MQREMQLVKRQCDRKVDIVKSKLVSCCTSVGVLCSVEMSIDQIIAQVEHACRLQPIEWQQNHVSSVDSRSIAAFNKSPNLSQFQQKIDTQKSISICHFNKIEAHFKEHD